MKPCYRHKDDLYLLAHLIRESDQFPQPCKALISPGSDPPVTMATRDFLQRCGWLTSEALPSKENTETTTVQGEESSRDTAQLVHCKLVVGKCQLSTVLQVVENVDFSEDCMLSKWHIHIGRNDFEALQQNAWDSDICYLPTSPEPGQNGGRLKCPSGCDSFNAALKNGHPDCLSYWHAVSVELNQGRGSSSFNPDQYYSIKAARMVTAEALLRVHDVLEIPWEPETCAATARFGSIDCLMYAHASECPWDSETCKCAAIFGNLDCLSYAHEHGCEWRRVVLLAAASRGHLECLKYAHTHGCPDTPSRDGCFWSMEPLTTQAASAPSMQCLVYVSEVMGCAWDPRGSESELAFRTGNLQLLQYIHTHGGVLCTQVCYEECKRWLMFSDTETKGRAMCLLYLRCYGGFNLLNIKHTRVGRLTQEIIKARRVAVLHSFSAAGKVCIKDPMIAAAHAAMQRMPSEVVHEIICAARLQVMKWDMTYKLGSSQPSS